MLVLDDYKWIRELGSGSFGQVDMYIEKNGPLRIAVKRCKNVDAAQGIDIDVLREVTALNAIGNHRHIIRLISVGWDNTRLLTALSCMDQDLHNMLEKNPGLPFKRAQSIYMQIRDGLQFMHTKGFMHRDVKPQNILCSKSVVKLADFGLAIRYIPGRLNTLPVQTLYWAAPEVLLGERTYTPAIDMWSLGMIFMKMVLHFTCMTLDDISDTWGASGYGQLLKIFSVRGTPHDIGACTQCPYWQTPLFPNFHKRNLELSSRLTSHQASHQASLIAIILDKTLEYDPRQRCMPSNTDVHDVPDIRDIATRGVVDPNHRIEDVQTLYTQATNINSAMREVLLDWLFVIHSKFKYSMHSFYLMVQIIDRYVASTPTIKRSELQLLGCAALFVTGKLMEDFPCEVRDFEYLSDYSSLSQDVLQMERSILSTLKYDIIQPTLLDWFCDEYCELPAALHAAAAAVYIQRCCVDTCNMRLLAKVALQNAQRLDRGDLTIWWSEEAAKGFNITPRAHRLCHVQVHADSLPTFLTDSTQAAMTKMSQCKRSSTKHTTTPHKKHHS